MCLFCKIANHEIKANVLYEDADVLAFADIHPVAKTHALVIPKRHVASLNDATPADAELLGKLLVCAAKIAKSEGVAESGWRSVVNTGPNAGQSVFHVHVHVLGGQPMAWPPWSNT